MCNISQVKFELIMYLLVLSSVINLCLIRSALTFNLSPTPNGKLTEPNLRFYPRKYESSYFGYQINLRQHSVIIAAPRGQTTFWSQRAFNETGALYKCNFNSAECEIWKIDDSDGRNEIDGYTHIKTKQWFGAAMDGDSSDNDLLTVCAPNIVSVKNLVFEYGNTEYYTHGKCYLIENYGKQEIKPFQPLSKSQHQLLTMWQGDRYTTFTHFQYGQMGVSVQMLKNNKEYLVLMGAPGLLTGCGGVVRWNTTRGVENLNEAFGQFDVSDPNYFASNSYFGYAVAMGNFLSKNRITYAASAPRVGLVRIFSFHEEAITRKNYIHKMRLGKQLVGEQLGEYFGYTLLADDFNNDQFTDLAIGAPMYTKKGIYENGKVYVYKCKLRDCTKGDALFSNHDESGRFGLTLAKIGDINRDGYNDLAVGAPYEGNGNVYIFHGGINGLSTVPSQIISAPENAYSFGLGLSKGVDIDQNFYNDLVIGAPESDAVFMYKSYPVVRILTIISTNTDKVSISDREISFTVCSRYVSPIPGFNVNILIMVTINLDPQLKRATFHQSNNRSNTIELEITNQKQNCQFHKVELTHNAVVQLPIVIEAQHELKKDFRQSNSFCTDCVAVNPSDPKVVQTRIAIKSGCSNDQWCMANLVVSSDLTAKSLTHVLGNPELIPIEYMIQNLGETAYFPKISITISPTTPFAKISPNCYLNETTLHCYLLNSIPLYSNNYAKCLITINPVDLVGDKVTITAVVSSSSNETNFSDNTLKNTIHLVEYNVIEIIGKSYPAQLSIDADDIIPKLNITHEFLIINYGHSTMKEIIFTAHIPQIYNHAFNLIDHIEISTDREELDFDDNAEDNHRTKRETLENIKAEVLENRIVHIPHHRARYFNCSPAIENPIHICNATTLRLYNFEAKEKIKITLNMTLNLEDLQSIVNKTHNMLLFEVIPSLEKINDPHMKTFRLTLMNTLTAIELITEGKTPLKWIIISIIVGILVLCGIIYWFSRMGFFRRKLQTEIKEIKRQTMQMRQSMAIRQSVQFAEIDEDEEESGAKTCDAYEKKCNLLNKK